MFSFANSKYGAMGFKKVLGVLFVVVFITSCGTSKLMTSYKTNAESFATTGNYTESTEAWKQYFDQISVEETAGVDFADAAKTAFKSGDIDLALSWFDQARYKNYSDFEMYKTLAEIQQKQKNISKELTALEYITENFGDQSNQIDGRLYEVYYEVDLKEQALQVWERLDETSKSSASNLESYFLIQKSLKDSTVCDAVSLRLLEKNPNNIEALEWNAKKYYWLGENRYQSELAQYEKKKTNKQYKILLKELDKATADLKKSMRYLDTLWKIDKKKEYASYFASIYGRFGDEKKTNYYKKLMK